MSDIFILETQREEVKKKRRFSFDPNDWNEWLISKQTLKIKSKVTFFRLLATMVNAGISVIKSLNILEKQERDPVMKRIYGDMAVGIKQGKTLSDMIRSFPQHFKESESSIIEAGEKTGRLNMTLTQLAEQTEKIDGITKKFKGAMIYPMAVMLIAISVVVIMMVVVVPRIVEIFGDRSKLPPMTQALMATSDFFVNYSYMLAGSLIIGLIILMIWKKTPTGKYQWSMFLLKIPIFGAVNQKIILSLFARVFSNLLTSGISIIESLRIIADVVGNEVYRQRFLLLREDIKKGVRIGESLDEDPLFPEMLVQMIKVGEETAKLDQIILKIADFYDDEVDITINNIQKLLEPGIIVFLGVTIGFIAVAIMQPIMNMGDIMNDK